MIEEKELLSINGGGLATLFKVANVVIGIFTFIKDVKNLFKRR